jgi:hypothetical protein
MFPEVTRHTGKAPEQVAQISMVFSSHAVDDGNRWAIATFTVTDGGYGGQLLGASKKRQFHDASTWRSVGEKERKLRHATAMPLHNRLVRVVHVKTLKMANESLFAQVAEYTMIARAVKQYR